MATSGERLRRKGRHGVFAGKTVRSIPEHFETIHSIKKLYKYFFLAFPFLLLSVVSPGFDVRGDSGATGGRTAVPEHMMLDRQLPNFIVLSVN